MIRGGNLSIKLGSIPIQQEKVEIIDKEQHGLSVDVQLLRRNIREGWGALFWLNRLNNIHPEGRPG